MDIIVFPECTLNKSATFVPKADSKIIPCNSTYDYKDYLKELSCAAANRSSYLIVNLNEKSICTPEQQAIIGDKRPCSSTGYNLYNTVVAFDRNGTVVSTYRKYHIIDTYGMNTTVRPEISTFITDYNVTYGLLTCFDILFEKPALILARQNIKNIIIPMMWNIELPFLTTLQVQQMFAVATNVNLLASGANNRTEGYGGSGIYQGELGPIVFGYVESGGSKVYITEVGKSPDIIAAETKNKYFKINEMEIDVHGKAMDGFNVNRDAQLDGK